MAFLAGPRILILFMLVSFPAVLAVLFTPALPQLAQDFQVSNSLIQISMSIFLFAYAIGQLPYAPLANRYGRKKTIYIGLCVSLVGTICCWFSPAISWFFIGRFIQALGGAVGLKITFTMIGDSHVGTRATKAISMMMLAFAIAPGLGIATGGFLTDVFGWRSCFAFLTVYTIFLALFCLMLPETASYLDKEALRRHNIFRGFRQQFSNSSLVFHAFFIGLGSSVIYLFATQAPYIAVNYVDLSPATYGLWNTIPLVGLVIGQGLASHFAGIFSVRLAMLWGIMILLIGVALMFFCFAADWINPWTLFISQAVVMTGNGWMCSNASSEALSSSSDKAHGAAILQFINMSCSASSTYIASSWLPQTVVTLPLMYTAIGVFAFVFWVLLRPYHR